MIASAAPLLAMSLEPTATVLAAAPPMAVLMTGMYLSSPVYQLEANKPQSSSGPQTCRGRR